MPRRDVVRVGVLSDTHGDEPSILRALARIRQTGGADMLCFLGDCVGDLLIIRAALTSWERPPVLHAVRGNNDVLARYPDEMLVQAGGKALLLVHGHLQRVRTHRLQLVLHAQERGADVALFGHTHQSECGFEQGVLLLNPGACSGRQPSYALLTIAAEELLPEINRL